MTTIDTSTEAVERLLDCVTPGPWAEHDAGKHPHVFVCGPDELYYNGEVKDKPLVAYVTGVGAIENRAFIAAARDLVPALLKERDEALARVSALEEITDPDFIWGAMDNVHDMDVTLDDYAKAVSRAQRAALAASQPADPVTNAGCRQPVKVKQLVWDRHPDADHDPSCNEHYGGGQNNLAGQNEYAIYPHPCAVGYFVLDAMGNRCAEDFPSIEAAKAAAQADYEGRILDALEATPVTLADALQVQTLVDEVSLAFENVDSQIDDDGEFTERAWEQLRAALAALKEAHK